jgi:CRP-like cAMP-binding protein
VLTIEKVALLKGTEIFAETPDHVLASVANIAETVHLEPDETFIHEGALEDTMFIIVEGTARVHVGDKTVATLGEGEMVGDMQVLDPAPRSASVTAEGKLKLFQIYKNAFDEVMADRPEISRGINRVLVRRLRAATAT